MPDLSVRCPECEARLRIPASKSAVRCPKCKTVVRVPAEDADDPDVRRPRERVRADRDEDERPARRRRDEEDERPRSRRRDEDEDDRPQRRSRDEDEDDRPRRRRRDDDEDDRPRRRPARDQGEGPWLIAVGVSALCFLLSLGLGFLLFGTTGLPPGKDGPNAKLIGMGIGLVAALIIIPVGVIGVKNRRATGKWGIVIEGSMGVATGFVQSILGGLIGGFTLYGLVFTLLNGR